MYRFTTTAFGVCNVRRQKQRGSGNMPEIVEVETFHGFSRIVSLYRYEGITPLSDDPTKQGELRLCRYAVAQFLRRNELIHVARVEILNTALPTYSGKLIATPRANSQPVAKFSDRCRKFNPVLSTY